MIAGGLLQGLGTGMMAQSTQRKQEESDKRKALIASLKAGGAGTSANEQRDWSRIIGRHTKDGGLMGGKITDYESAAKEFDRQDMPKFAAEARGFAEATIDRDSDEFLEIEAQVIKDAKARNPVGPDFLRSDKALKDAYDGKTEDEWIKDTSEQRYRTEKGMAPNQATGNPTSTTAVSAPGEYATEDDVGKAYANGQISRDEARKILKDQFGQT